MDGSLRLVVGSAILSVLRSDGGHSGFLLHKIALVVIVCLARVLMTVILSSPSHRVLLWNSSLNMAFPTAPELIPTVLDIVASIAADAVLASCLWAAVDPAAGGPHWQGAATPAVQF